MCPFCKNLKSKVISTENYETFIRRRRQCAECGGQFYGREEYDGIIKAPEGYSAQGEGKNVET